MDCQVLSHRAFYFFADSIGGPFPVTSHRCHHKQKHCPPVLPGGVLLATPLLFHPHTKGSQILMDLSHKAVKRQASFCNAITFSNRPVLIYEQVRLKVGLPSPLSATASPWASELRPTPAHHYLCSSHCYTPHLLSSLHHFCSSSPPLFLFPLPYSFLNLPCMAKKEGGREWPWGLLALTRLVGRLPGRERSPNGGQAGQCDSPWVSAGGGL